MHVHSLMQITHKTDFYDKKCLSMALKGDIKTYSMLKGMDDWKQFAIFPYELLHNFFL